MANDFRFRSNIQNPNMSRQQRLVRPDFIAPQSQQFGPMPQLQRPSLAAGPSAAAPSGGISNAQLSGGLGLAAQASGVGGGQTELATSALGGAAAGSALGPVGAGVGAGVGLVGGLAGIRSRKKQKAADAESKKQQAIADIEIRRGQQQQLAFGNIISALRSAFLG